MNKLYVIQGYWNEIYLNYYPVISTSSNLIIDIVNKNEGIIPKTAVDYTEFHVFAIENPYSAEELKLLRDFSKITTPEISVFSYVLDSGFLETPLYLIKDKINDKEKINLEKIGTVNTLKLHIPDTLIFLSDLQDKIKNWNNKSDKTIFEYLNLTKEQYNNLLKYKYIDTNN